MKRISIFAWIISVSLCSMVWAQPNTLPRVKSRPPRHPDINHAGRATHLGGYNFVSQAKPNCSNKVWELGTYPGGTWAALGDINDYGIAVGTGDVPPLGPDGVGETHPLAVSLFGPHAGEWIDLGTLGQATHDWEEPINTISNTGLIVGHSTTAEGYEHGFVWSEKTGIVDLGTLAAAGYPAYKASWATAINRSGTLIVGWSGVELACLDCAPALPVVWTPLQVWKHGQLVTKWKVHKLDTAAFPDLVRWYSFSVNDFGQIISIAWNDEETVGVPILWNQRPDGKSWKAMALPQDPDNPYILPFSINNRGEIAGSSAPADWSNWFPRFWKPLDHARKTYSLPLALALPEGYSAGGYADGINDFGDITGQIWGDAPDAPAARWNTKNPSFVESLGFPGDWSWSFSLNNSRIAVITYGGGSCAGASCGGAIRFTD